MFANTFGQRSDQVLKSQGSSKARELAFQLKNYLTLVLWGMYAYRGSCEGVIQGPKSLFAETGSRKLWFTASIGVPKPTNKE
jgi:hypothetical protein